MLTCERTTLISPPISFLRIILCGFARRDLSHMAELIPYIGIQIGVVGMNPPQFTAHKDGARNALSEVISRQRQ
jgi:hypothetical protein